MNFVCKRECTYNLWYWTFDISQKKTTFWPVLHFVPPGMGFCRRCMPEVIVEHGGAGGGPCWEVSLLAPKRCWPPPSSLWSSAPCCCGAVESAKCKVQAGSEVLAIAGGRDAALYTRVTGLLCSSASYRHIHKDNNNNYQLSLYSESEALSNPVTRVTGVTAEV